MNRKYLRMKSMWVAVWAVGPTLCGLNSARADVLYVNRDSEAVFPDGLSWETAFQDLHDALGVCQDTLGTWDVWVREGVYTASSQYIMYDGCHLYGGFVGNETQREERDWKANITTLDGGNSTRVILRANNGATGAVLDGFVVQNGHVGGWGSSISNSGGGILVNNGILTVRNCTIRDNFADSRGGGIALFDNSYLLITNSVITNNESSSFGGGIAFEIDFAPPPPQGAPWIIDCFNTSITGNTASAGGGVRITSLAFGNFRNTLIADNTATLAMAGMVGRFQLSSCTVVNNHVVTPPSSQGLGGGVTCLGSSTIENTIIWGNTHTAPNRFGSQLVLETGTTLVRHSDVQFGFEEIWRWTDNAVDWDDGVTNTNIGELDGSTGETDNPLFVDDIPAPWSIPDYRITATSKCIDSASNLRVPEDVADVDGDGDLLERVPLDLRGLARFVDDPATDDAGVPDPPLYVEVTDMGANEFDCAIVAMDPPDGAIDARQPTSLDGGMVFGWDEVTFEVNAAVAAEVNVNSATVASTSGIAPTVQSVTVDGIVVTVTLDGPIPPSAWTRITLNSDLCSASVCLGYLPGDVNGDRVSAPDDILAVIDCLNGVATFTCNIWNTDIDRSGVAGPEDILRVIDLLNGAAAFDPWLDATLDGSACDSLVIPVGGGGGSGGGSPGKLDQLPNEPVYDAEGALADAYLAMLTELQWSPIFNDSEIATSVVVTTIYVAEQLNDGLINRIVGVLEDPTTVYSHPVVAALVPDLILRFNIEEAGTPIPNGGAPIPIPDP